MLVASSGTEQGIIREMQGAVRCRLAAEIIQEADHKKELPGFWRRPVVSLCPIQRYS